MADGIVISNLTVPAIKGDKGDKGDAGKIVGLTITMLDSTATPTVTNTGTQSEANYTIGIPRGTGISTAVINEDGELVLTLTDETELNLGVIMPTSIASVSMDEEFNFVVTLTDDTEVEVGNLAEEMEDVIETALADYYDKDTAEGMFGHSLSLSLNQSTYVMTIGLVDYNGTTLDTKAVDLPLESVVVSGTYDNTTKKVILTLQSGSTIEFSVADLVAGLQTEITNANKLSADLVDDTSTTHKFVTASDKTTWNAKYDKPSGGIPSTDMASAVQTSLGKADTALQSTDIVSSVDSSSTNSKAVGAKLFYDTIGDINTILDTINGEVI